jgi:hypothetical protein
VACAVEVSRELHGPDGGRIGDEGEFQPLPNPINEPEPDPRPQWAFADEHISVSSSAIQNVIRSVGWHARKRFGPQRVAERVRPNRRPASS